MPQVRLIPSRIVLVIPATRGAPFYQPVAIPFWLLIRTSGFKCFNTEGSYYCEPDLTPLAIVLPVVFGILLLLLLIWFLATWVSRRLAARYLSALPPEVRWTYKDAVLHPGDGWVQEGGFWTKEIVRDSPEWDRSCQVFNTLRFADLHLGRVFAVYNQMLVETFVTTYTVQQQRFEESKALFFAKKWDQADENKKRVFAKFEARTKLFPWNAESVPIIPVAHGTDFAVAERIAKTGFAALSSIDEGL